jgi:hypothetical protein
MEKDKAMREDCSFFSKYYFEKNLHRFFRFVSDLLHKFISVQNMKQTNKHEA